MEYIVKQLLGFLAAVVLLIGVAHHAKADIPTEEEWAEIQLWIVLKAGAEQWDYISHPLKRCVNSGNHAHITFHPDPAKSNVVCEPIDKSEPTD